MCIFWYNSICMKSILIMMTRDGCQYTYDIQLLCVYTNTLTGGRKEAKSF